MSEDAAESLETRDTRKMCRGGTQFVETALRLLPHLVHVELVDVLLEEVDGDGALVGRVPPRQFGGRAVTVVLLGLVVVSVVLAVSPVNRPGKEKFTAS